MISRSFSVFMRAIPACADNGTNKEQKQVQSLSAARIWNCATTRCALDVPHRLLRSDFCRKSTPLERTA
jgi:hypothetical protein